MIRTAVAVDLGASSVRFAEGTIDGERIEWRIAGQSPHEPVETASGPVWSIDTLVHVCRQAELHAKSIGATLGIDSWGVDQGFLDREGRLLQPPACYRHPAHVKVFEEMAPHRHRLFQLTGVQHQPFNTIYQLIARARERPELNSPDVRWLNLPELMAHLLGAEAGHEITQASTTQLLGLDGTWSEEAFEIAGWKPPEMQPALPGGITAPTANGVPVVRVGGHDTASAVCGMGSLKDDQAFLSVGTWSLLGVVLERPLTSDSAEAANFTNERAVDGRVRFLANVPGFFIVNGLHRELSPGVGLPEWLASANLSFGGRIDPMDPAFFQPKSMAEAVRSRATRPPDDPADWSAIALLSLAECLAKQVSALEEVTGRRIRELRVAGGGSASDVFCQCLANAANRAVLAGPQEATVLGNLAVQFLAQGAFSGVDEMARALANSVHLRGFDPGFAFSASDA